jgi:hypothetical protein
MPIFSAAQRTAATCAMHSHLSSGLEAPDLPSAPEGAHRPARSPDHEEPGGRWHPLIHTPHTLHTHSILGTTSPTSSSLAPKLTTKSSRRNQPPNSHHSHISTGRPPGPPPLLIGPLRGGQDLRRDGAAAGDQAGRCVVGFIFGHGLGCICCMSASIGSSIHTVQHYTPQKHMHTTHATHRGPRRRPHRRHIPPAAVCRHGLRAGPVHPGKVGGSTETCLVFSAYCLMWGLRADRLNHRESHNRQSITHRRHPPGPTSASPPAGPSLHTWSKR